MFGEIVSYGAGGYDLYLVKTDVDGNQLWEKAYGGADDDRSAALVITADGSIVMAGLTMADNGRNDAYVVKTDSAGNVQWSATWGTDFQDGATGIVEDTDGGFVVTGKSVGGTTATEYDYFLWKLDSNGNEVWSHTYLNPRGDWPTNVEKTADGGNLIFGTNCDYENDDCNFLLMKTDAVGTKEWLKTVGGNGDDGGHLTGGSLGLVLDDGSYMLAGFTDSGAYDVWLVHTDTDGNIIWDKTFGGDDVDAAMAIKSTADGGYIVSGATVSYGAGAIDIYLIKTDSEGNVY